MELRRSCKFILPKEMYPVFLLAGKIISKNDSYKFCGLEKCKKKIDFHKFCKCDLLIKIAVSYTHLDVYKRQPPC